MFLISDAHSVFTISDAEKKYPLSFHLWIKRLLHLVILIYSCCGFYLVLSACAIYSFWWLYVCSSHIWVGRSFNYLPCTYMHIKLFKALVYRSSGIQNTTKRNLMLIFWILLTSQKKCSSYLLTFFPRFSSWCKFRCLFACLLMSIAFAFMFLFVFLLFRPLSVNSKQIRFNDSHWIVFMRYLCSFYAAIGGKCGM